MLRVVGVSVILIILLASSLYANVNFDPKKNLVFAATPAGKMMGTDIKIITTKYADYFAKDPREIGIAFPNMVYNWHTFYDARGIPPGLTPTTPVDYDNLKLDKYVLHDANAICDGINKKAGMTHLDITNVFFNSQGYTNENVALLYAHVGNVNSTNNSAKKFLCMHITSNNDTNGINVILEQVTSPPQFSNYFRSIGGLLVSNAFKSNSSAFGPVIRVNKNDTLTASIMNSVTGQPVSVTANIAWSLDNNKGKGLGGGSTAPPPVLYPYTQTRYVCQTNISGDGLCDEWRTGIGVDIYYNGIDYSWNCPDPYGAACPSVGSKDIFIQLDQVSGYGTSDAVLTDIVRQFSQLHNSNSPINLHFQRVNENIDLTTLNIGCTSNQCHISFPATFGKIKTAEFSSDTPSAQDQKSQIFRYVLFAYESGNIASSGNAEYWGDDAQVTLGNPTFNNNGQGDGTTDEQEGTLMHELGHLLNLHHGGADDINCKPNYLSVMNYAFQFNTLVPSRPYDYAESQMPSIPQPPISESMQIAANYHGITVFGDPNGGSHNVPTGPLSPGYGINFDWNAPVPDSNGYATENSNLGMDNFPVNKISSITACTGNSTQLNGNNDWPALKLNYRTSANFKASSGLEASHVDVTPDDVKNMSLDRINQINSTLIFLKPTDQSYINADLEKAKEYTAHYDYNNALPLLQDAKAFALKNNAPLNLINTMISVNHSFMSSIVNHSCQFCLGVPLSTIIFDKPDYSTSGTVKVTVNDTNAVLNPKLIESLPVNIYSSADFTGFNVTLTETSPGTGIFTNDITLTTGSTNPADKELHVTKDAIIVAPYDGFLASSNVTIPPVTLVMPNQSTSGTVKVTVNDTSSVSNPTLIESLPVHIYSSADLTGFNVTLTETGPGTGIFTNDITLTTGSTNPTSKLLHVTNDSTLTVPYDGFMTSENVITSSKGTILLHAVMPHIPLVVVPSTNTTVSSNGTSH